MIALLGRLFIKDHANTADESVRRAWGTLCGVMGVVLEHAAGMPFDDLLKQRVFDPLGIR